MENFSLVQKESGKNFFHANLHLSNTDDCPDCKGTGVFRWKIKSAKTEVKCNKCKEGYIAVKCRNCNKGWIQPSEEMMEAYHKNPEKYELGPPQPKQCNTCAGTGTYVYRPSFKFPDGKKCKYCHGTTKLTRIVNVKTEPIKCRLCSGEGKIAATKRVVFNPLINDTVLDKILNMMAGVQDTKEISSMEEIPTSDVPELYPVGHISIMKVKVLKNGIVDSVQRL